METKPTSRRWNDVEGMVCSAKELEGAIVSKEKPAKKASGRVRAQRSALEPATLSDLDLLHASERLTCRLSSVLVGRGIAITVPHVVFRRDVLEGVATYDPVGRQIVLASSLLAQDWQTVCDLGLWGLAHEVARVYRKNAVSDDEAYALAWRRLALEARFQVADLRLATLPPGWRATSEGSEERRFLEKIDKLFALGSSSNEAEASLAMERAQELLASRNLRRSQTDGSGMVRFELVLPGRRIESTFSHIASILVSHYFVKVVIGRAWDVAAGEERPSFHILGRRDNVLMAEHVFDFLSYEIETLWAEARVAKGLAARARLIDQLGLLEGFDAKLKALKANRATQAEEAALVLLVGGPN